MMEEKQIEQIIKKHCPNYELGYKYRDHIVITVEIVKKIITDILNDGGRLPKSEWENCPNYGCNNSGVYLIPINRYDDKGFVIDGWEDYESQQCEFCYTNPKSVFNQKRINSTI